MDTFELTHHLRDITQKIGEADASLAALAQTRAAHSFAATIGAGDARARVREVADSERATTAEREILVSAQIEARRLLAGAAAEERRRADIERANRTAEMIVTLQGQAEKFDGLLAAACAAFGEYEGTIADIVRIGVIKEVGPSAKGYDAFREALRATEGLPIGVFPGFPSDGYPLAHWAREIARSSPTVRPVTNEVA